MYVIPSAATKNHKSHGYSLTLPVVRGPGYKLAPRLLKVLGHEVTDLREEEWNEG